MNNAKLTPLACDDIFSMDQAMMVFDDAKNVVEDIIKALEH
ncbi:MAG TPA: hypothetical protein VIU46_03560 [Gallionellaceae bacterium]